MPNYTFKNKRSGREFDKTMSMADRETYLKENPNVEQVIKKVTIADPISIGVTKPDSTFSKYVLGKVAQMPGANKAAIEKRYQIAKEI